MDFTFYCFESLTAAVLGLQLKATPSIIAVNQSVTLFVIKVRMYVAIYY